MLRHTFRSAPLVSTLLAVLLAVFVPAFVFGQDAGAKPKARKPRPTSVGPAIGGNKATPIDRIKAAKGFEVELLYSVPGQDQGSWVNLCTDDKGRILVSDQFGGLYRITPPPAGEAIQPLGRRTGTGGHSRRQRHGLGIRRPVCRRQ